MNELAEQAETKRDLSVSGSAGCGGFKARNTGILWEIIMTVKCIKCRNCINDPITAGSGDQFCKAEMWNRYDDDFLNDNAAFEKYIKKDIFCSEYKSNAE